MGNACLILAAVVKINCVFVAHFVMLQREMRGYMLQLSPQLRWSMKVIFPGVDAPSAGRYGTRVLLMWAVRNGCGWDRRNSFLPQCSLDSRLTIWIGTLWRSTPVPTITVRLGFRRNRSLLDRMMDLDRFSALFADKSIDRVKTRKGEEGTAVRTMRAGNAIRVRLALLVRFLRHQRRENFRWDGTNRFFPQLFGLASDNVDRNDLRVFEHARS
jgi:hypothetical protein